MSVSDRNGLSISKSADTLERILVKSRMLWNPYKWGVRGIRGEEGDGEPCQQHVAPCVKDVE